MSGFLSRCIHFLVSVVRLHNLFIPLIATKFTSTISTSTTNIISTISAATCTTNESNGCGVECKGVFYSYTTFVTSTTHSPLNVDGSTL